MAPHLSRRRFLAVSTATAVSAAVALPVGRTRAASEVSWLMHPVHWKQMGDGELLQKLTKETGITVKPTQMPFPQYREKLTILLRQGSADFDIVGISNSWWDGSVNRYLQPLDAFMTKKPLENPKDIVGDYLYNVSGQTYAVPYRIGPMVLHYRKDLYEKYRLKVPRTFDEYRHNAKTIQDGEKGAVHGVFVMGEQSFFSLWDWTSYLFSFGGAFLDSPDSIRAKVIVNAKQGAEAMKYFANLNLDRLTPPGTLTATWNTFITLMQQGKLAQGINWSVYIEPIASPDKSTVADKVAWAEAPYAAGSGLTVGRTGTVGWGLFIPTASKNQDAAWDVLRWITKQENDLYMGVHGGGPFRASTLKSKEYAATAKATDIILKAILSGLPVWNPIGTLPHASEVIDKSVVEINGALAGKVSAQDAVNNMARHIKEIALA